MTITAVLNRRSVVLTMLCAWLVTPVATIAGTAADNLVPQGQFKPARGDRPDGWVSAEPKQGWMIDKFKVINADDRTFARATEGPALIATSRPVDPAWAEVVLKVETRRSGYAQGANRWDTMLVELDFLGDDGKSLLDWRKATWLDGDTDGWQPTARTYPVPSGAVTMVARLGHKAAKGTIDFADLTVTATKQRSAAEQQAARDAMAAAQRARDEAAAKVDAERRIVKPADPSKVTGANIDESIVKSTLHVRLDAAPGGDGSAARPFARVADALKAADESLRALVPTKIVLGPGTYREGEFIITGGQMNQPNPPAANTLLVIEGAAGGQTVLSGSDVYAPSEWAAVKDAAGAVLYYEHPWTHDFGNVEGPWGQYNPKKLLGHRAELAFINGQHLQQVILEDYAYAPGQGWSGKGKHEYKGFLDPAIALRPGTFGVAERDDHPQGNRIFIKPPAGVAWDDATIEVAVRRHLLHTYYKNNLVLRDLVFQHAASTHNTPSAALRIGHWHHLQAQLQNNDVLLDRVQVRWNGGFGVKIGTGRNVTVRDSAFTYNGHSGVNTGTMHNVLVDRCDLSFNNWRGHLGGLYGWAVGGIKLHQMYDCLIRDTTAIGNMAPGIWFDVNNTNCTIERSTIVANRRGIFLEISPGPFLVKDTLVAADRYVGLVLTNAANVTVEDSIFHGAARQLVSVCLNEDRGSGNGIEAAMGIEPPLGGGGEVVGTSEGKRVFRQGATLLSNSVFVNPTGPLVMQDPSSPPLYIDWLTHMLRSQGNLWHSGAAKPFGVGYTDTAMTDLAGWRAATGQDAASTFGPPTFTAADRFDYTPTGDNASRRAPGRGAARQVDPAQLAKARAFFDAFGYGDDGAGAYKDDPLQHAH